MTIKEPTESLDPTLDQTLDEKYPGRTVHREGDQIVVTIPVKFYRRNGRQSVNAQPNTESAKSKNDPIANDTLVAAIAKAWAWQEEFESGIAAGQYATLEDFAKEKGVDRSYAGRLLRLTSLSPALVEQILNGNEPEGISLRQLTKGIPLLWSEQEE